MAAKTPSADLSGIKILIVDDEPMVCSVLKDQLQPEGYHITTAESSPKALDLLSRGTYSVVLTDHEMPEMTGLDLLGKIKENYPTTTRLLLSTGLSLTALSEAIRNDVIYRFVTKPWLKEELLVTMRNAITHNQLVSENKALHERNIHLNLKISKFTEEAETSAARTGGPSGGTSMDDNMSFGPATGIPMFEETSAAGGATATPPPPGVDLAMASFGKMLYTYHPNLGNTSVRAVALCQTLAEVLELSPVDSRNLLWAATLHDISLVGVDRGIVRRWLRGPEKCTEEELVVIKKHPEQTQQMLESLPFLKEAGEIIRSHHERWEGGGYPDNLKGEMIPKLSRLLSVVIVYCSKHSASIQALSEIEAESEKSFDPDAISALAKAAPLTKMPQGEREILLIELKAGMTLAREIYNANGFLLLPKGRELTEASINKLFQINRVTPIDPLCLVYC